MLFDNRAKPSGLTVTSLPGWLNITFAAVGEISWPNKQNRLPFKLSPLAHLANSSGDGGWPISAAQRRTMKPSIIFESSLLFRKNPGIKQTYRKSFFTLQEIVREKFNSKPPRCAIVQRSAHR
jgi:hypothetical protein